MPIPFLIAAGLVTKGLTSVFQGIKGAQMMNQAKKIKPVYNPYQINQSASDMLGRAQTQVNGQSAFSAMRQRGILNSQANAMAGVQRGVVDPGQALAMYAGLSAKSDDEMNNQFMLDNQLQQQREANLMNAQNVMIGEGDKKYNDMWRKYQADTEMKMALQNAGRQSVINAGNSLASTLFAAHAAKTGLAPTGGGATQDANQSAIDQAQLAGKLALGNYFKKPE